MCLSFYIESINWLCWIGAIRITVRSRNLDSFQCRFQSSRGIPYKMSEAAPANQMTPVHSKRRDWVHRSAVIFRVNMISPQLFFFGHVARLQEDVPAHEALNCHVDLSLGRTPSSQWSRRPGRPRNRWVDQIRWDNNLSPADVWRRAVSRGQRETTLRTLPAKGRRRMMVNEWVWV